MWRLLLMAAAVSPPLAPRPKLVVVLSVDQLRPDYLDRYRTQLIGGLGMLLREGAVFSEAYQDHAVTETAPGHASVLSGRWPAHTGIVRNDAGVQDSTAPLLEVPGPGASPSRFRGTTLFDWLHAAEPEARALGVSRKDRGAILLIGTAKQQVYWYRAGLFTTSRYYADSLPGWVRAFNAARLPFQATGESWPLLLAPDEYPEPDSEPYEHGGVDVVFPHRLPADSARAADSLITVPTMDSLTLAFALAGVRALGLGGRGVTDLLAVSLSTTDAVGHRYGPESREIHDQVLRLDRYLDRFLGQLFVRYGPENVLVVLTADHGVTPFPEWARSHGHPDARRVGVDSIVRDVNAQLDQRAGPRAGGWLSFDTGMFILAAHDTLTARGVNVDSVVGDVARRVRGLPGVARVDRTAELLDAGKDSDPVVRRWRHSLAPGAGVDLVVTLAPYCIWSETDVTTEHGQPSEMDGHVPLILWGRGVEPGTYTGWVSVVDIAPTLARLLDVTPAEPLDGRVLREALEQGTAKGANQR
jgi:predicted AlkP superfamily pyrophosphatase or phosphodiesterase